MIPTRGHALALAGAFAVPRAAAAAFVPRAQVAHHAGLPMCAGHCGDRAGHGKAVVGLRTDRLRAIKPVLTDLRRFPDDNRERG